MPKRATRTQRKGATEANDKQAEDEEPAPEQEPANVEPKDVARGGAGPAKVGGAGKPASAKKENPPKPISARDEKEGKMDEVSEERSGDQPVQDDDATTAPVPDRVRVPRPRARPPSPGANPPALNLRFSPAQQRETRCFKSSFASADDSRSPLSLSRFAGPGRRLPHLSGGAQARKGRFRTGVRRHAAEQQPDAPRRGG